MRLSAAIEQFVASKLNAETRRAYGEDLAYFAQCVGDRELIHIELRDIALYRDYLEEHTSPRTGRPLAPASVNKRIKTVQTFFRWAVRHGHLAHSPSEALSLSRLRLTPHKKAIPDRDLARMLGAVDAQLAGSGPWVTRAPERDRFILTLLINAGVRRSDLVRLRITDVDLEAREAVLRRKGDQVMELPLIQGVVDAYQNWMAVRPRTRHNYVLVNLADSAYPPMTPASVSQAFRRIAKRVTGHSYGPHGARHGLAYRMLKNQVPIPVAQRILGHATPSMLLTVYAVADLEDMRAALESTPLQSAVTQPVEDLATADSDCYTVYVDVSDWGL